MLFAEISSAAFATPLSCRSTLAQLCASARAASLAPTRSKFKATWRGSVEPLRHPYPYIPQVIRPWQMTPEALNAFCIHQPLVRAASWKGSQEGSDQTLKRSYVLGNGQCAPGTCGVISCGLWMQCKSHGSKGVVLRKHQIKTCGCWTICSQNSHDNPVVWSIQSHADVHVPRIVALRLRVFESAERRRAMAARFIH